MLPQSDRVFRTFSQALQGAIGVDNRAVGKNFFSDRATSAIAAEQSLATDCLTFSFPLAADHPHAADWQVNAGSGL